MVSYEEEKKMASQVVIDSGKFVVEQVLNRGARPRPQPVLQPAQADQTPRCCSTMPGCL
jgi:hypothetical protein